MESATIQSTTAGLKQVVYIVDLKIRKNYPNLIILLCTGESNPKSITVWWFIHLVVDQE